MRRLGLLIIGLTIGCFACERRSPASNEQAQPSQPEPARACVLGELATLSERLERLSIIEQSEQVWPALEAACAGLPNSLRSYYGSLHDPADPSVPLISLDDEQLRALRLAACPKLADVGAQLSAASSAERARVSFEVCEFGRYGVLDIDELSATTPVLMTLAVHDWLLAQGLDAAKARPISRALYALEFMNDALIGSVPKLRWPTARGVTLDGGVPVVLSAEALTFNDMTMAEVSSGRLSAGQVQDHLIVSLYDELQVAVERDPEAGLLIAADADTPFVTIVDLIYTAVRAGMQRYAFVVAPERFALVGVPTLAPAPTSDGEPDFMTMELSPQGVSVSNRDREGEPMSHPAVAFDAIEAHAKAVRASSPAARRVYVSATPDLKLEALLQALAAARGGDCTASGEGCLLPEVVLLDGKAHGYGVPIRDAIPSL